MAAILATFSTSTFAGGEISFVENYAIGKDREAALRQLIPGTDDYYYYHALNYLSLEQFDKIEPLQKLWIERLGTTARYQEIELRHKLLTFDKNPERTLEFLRRKLGLNFHHQKVVPGAAPPGLPTALDPKLLEWNRLRDQALRNHQTLNGFEETSLERLATTTNLDWELRRQLLKRLTMPDFPWLVKLIHEDLKSPHPEPFGSYAIHAKLTRVQLEELAQLRPELRNHSAYVHAMLAKLRPGADDDWRRDPALTLAYLERLESFVTKLDPVHNSLKAHVLYHRLAFDRSRGILEESRFVEYLKLPRHEHYIAKKFRENAELFRHPVDLHADYNSFTMMPRVGSDEPLVRSLLSQLFVKADSTKPYEPYIDDVYLRHLFAETKLEHGLGDPENWASLLPPERFRAFKERIDIEFAPTNRTEFASDEPVRMELAIKNVPNLLVKVFEINNKNVLLATGKEVANDVNLDGLTAGSEKTHKSDDSPLRRSVKQFEFPAMNKPGLYVVDFIGGGRSSRAFVRKGRLHAISMTGAAGQYLTIVDDARRIVTDAVVNLGGNEYRPEKDGRVLIPFTAAPGVRPIVISRGDFACLETIAHAAETYQLQAGIYIDREALLARQTAHVLVRPKLRLGDRSVSIQVLENVQLVVASTDLSGITAKTTARDFKLFEDRESIQEIRVPTRTRSLTVTLTGEVKTLATGKPVPLEVHETFSLNGIDETYLIEDLHLASFQNEHVLEVLGKTGEPRADRPVSLELKHHDFRDTIHAVLKTDAAGRIQLGRLDGIVTVTARGAEGTSRTWNLDKDRILDGNLIHARVGEPVRVPYFGHADKPRREEVSLFEWVGSEPRADQFEKLAILDGMLEAKGLPAGDYMLRFKERGEQYTIRIVDGPVASGYVLGKTRFLKLPARKPVHLRNLESTADEIVVRVTEASPLTRVHLLATRYQPDYSAFGHLAMPNETLGGILPGYAETIYVSGRDIGDEYRYVLERRNQKKYPGNMLERPSLLLNPWAVRETTTGEQQAQAGTEYEQRERNQLSRQLEEQEMQGKMQKKMKEYGHGPNLLGANLEYLSETAVVLTNLVPDKDGFVKIPRKLLGSHAFVRAVVVDPSATIERNLKLPETPVKFLDLRPLTGLDPAGRFTQQKQVTLLESGAKFTLEDAADCRFEVYDSIAKVHALYKTMTNDPKLTEFAFITRWPTLKEEEKRELYSKYACHELSFFLSRKDPEFFAKVVKPYLEHKKDKTFLDEWLLEKDLGRYFRTWEYGRLNTVEQILLARRLAGEGAKTTRHLADLVKLLPPDVEMRNQRFDTALIASVLEHGHLSDMAADEKAKAGAPPAPAMGGGFGGTDMPGRKRGDAGGEGKGRGYQGKPGQGAQRDGRSGAKKIEEAKEGQGKEGREEADAAPADNEVIINALDMDRRKTVKQLFRKPDATWEWAENNYYHLPITAQTGELVKAKELWLDYSKNNGGPFLSKQITDAGVSFTEAMFALAVLDLPFETPKHEFKFEKGRLDLTVGGRAIVFHEEVRKAEEETAKVPVLVGQSFLREGDRFRLENGEKIDKLITEEFLTQVVYVGRVTVTNTASARQKLSVLIQLPCGAMPLGDGRFTRSFPTTLEPFATQAIEYRFYFPKAGEFKQFPAQAARNERYVAGAAPQTFVVRERPSKVDAASWDYVSQEGSSDDVLAYLERENVQSLDLSKIAFRMRDRNFYDAVTRLLEARRDYDSVLWSYAVHHGDVKGIREYLMREQSIVTGCGGPLVSTILNIDPVETHHYEHLEYRPIVNARAHALGATRKIVNDRLHQQYHHFLAKLAYARELSDTDRLALTYYLLLQDRVDEALSTFATVNVDKITTKMQYDYCAAYLAFSSEEPAKARAIAIKYSNHPVDRWRNAFTAITAQLDEAEGKQAKVVDPLDPTQRQGQLAVTEPTFESAVEGKAIELTWKNLDKVQVNYYIMDVELMFSRNPFVQQSADHFSRIKPNATQEVKLPGGKSVHSIPLPEELHKKNVLIEVVGGGKRRTCSYHATVMKVDFMESYGQLRATSGDKPLAKVYVKVYSQSANGQVKFHKDGYTDLRGRFDYMSVHTPESGAIEKLSILVMSDDQGALIREVKPPQQ